MSVQEVQAETTAYWYVPDLPDVVGDSSIKPTIFDPDHNTDSGKTAAQIQEEFSDNIAATGLGVITFKPERMALQETLISLSLQLYFEDEEQLTAAFDDIYSNHVLPQMEQYKELFQTKVDILKQKIRDGVKAYFQNEVPNQEDEDECTINQELHTIHAKFKSKLASYKKELRSLEQSAAEERPNRQQRNRLYSLRKITEFMDENEQAIIADLARDTLVEKLNRSMVRSIISGVEGQSLDTTGQPILVSEEITSKYKELNKNSAYNRRSILVVGGPACGKGSIVDRVKAGSNREFITINPDFYRQFLLSYDQMDGGDTKLHSAMTQQESSLVFSEIATRWQSMAENGQAPDLLMDIVRAGVWMRNIAGSGGTKTEIHSPLLPIEEALERAYQRGQHTGRYVSTSYLLQSHKDQVDINLRALVAGNDLVLYNNNVPYGTPSDRLAVAAHCDAKQSLMKIHDFEAVYAYFKKNGLNIGARDSRNLWLHNVEDLTVEAMLSYADHVQMDIEGPSGTSSACLYKEGEDYIFDVKSLEALEAALGPQELSLFLHALVAKGVSLQGEAAELEVNFALEEEGQIFAKNFERSSHAQATEGIDVKEYASLLRRLVNDGVRVAKTENIYTFDVRKNEADFPLGVQVTTINLDDGTVAERYHYDQESEDKNALQIIIDPRVHTTPEKRKSIISQIKETGVFEGPGVYMKRAKDNGGDYVVDGIESESGLSLLRPDPEKVRVALGLDSPVTVPVTWYPGATYRIEKHGSLVIREEDFEKLKEALRQYDDTGDDAYLIDVENRQALIDVYGTDPYFVEDQYAILPARNFEYLKLLDQILLEGCEVSRSKNGAEQKYVALQTRKGQAISIGHGDAVRRVTHPDWIAVPLESLKSLARDAETGAGDLGQYFRRLGDRTVRKSCVVHEQNVDTGLVLSNP